MTESKNSDPSGCPDTTIGGCEPVCARCGRDMDGLAVVDLSALFRAAAAVAERAGWDAAAHVFGALAVKAKHHPHEVEAIGRALLGGAPPGRATADSESTVERDPS